MLLRLNWLDLAGEFGASILAHNANFEAVADADENAAENLCPYYNLVVLATTYAAGATLVFSL